ncbi:unnamed protein product [Blepharisma stoltei]|uniref:Mitochondrial carrier protein n=1 Tax=Blepharisma stoltei TaxID=1481888 RepID=A0AAU9KCM7_9CILI|nr:unnamed protein product [Blepharisma stoltei]
MKAYNPELDHLRYANHVNNFLIGGFAGVIGTIVILPVDYVKVKIQGLAEGHRGDYEKPLHFAQRILKEKGIKKFYSGIHPAIHRQAIYSTTRIGLYKTLSDHDKEHSGQPTIPFVKKAFYSIFSGGLASFLVNPLDLTMVRLRYDHKQYSGIFDAQRKMIKEEGIFTFWKGSVPTILRAMIINFTMLATYDESNEHFMTSFEENPSHRFFSSVLAATLSCIVAMPFDNIKVKYQRMEIGPDGTFKYKGFIDCVRKSLKSEGFWRLYTGFPLFVMKLAPHVVITLLTMDLLHHLIDPYTARSLKYNK